MRPVSVWEFREGRLDRLHRILEKKPKTLGELLEAFNLKLEDLKDVNLDSKVFARIENKFDELTYAYLDSGKLTYYVLSPIKNKPGFAVIENLTPIYNGAKI